MKAEKKPSAAAMRALRKNQEQHLYALRTGEGMGISTAQMALNIDAEFAPLVEALRALAAFQASCDNPGHKPLRFPRCPMCQLAGRIEVARAALATLEGE